MTVLVNVNLSSFFICKCYIIQINNYSSNKAADKLITWLFLSMLTFFSGKFYTIHINNLSLWPTVNLMAHNCQKWKGRFFAYPCHKICRVEVVSLSISNCTFKITILVGVWEKNAYFLNNYLIKVQISKSFAHMWHKYTIVITCHTPHFIFFILSIFS